MPNFDFIEIANFNIAGWIVYISLAAIFVEPEICILLFCDCVQHLPTPAYVIFAVATQSECLIVILSLYKFLPLPMLRICPSSSSCWSLLELEWVDSQDDENSALGCPPDNISSRSLAVLLCTRLAYLPVAYLALLFLSLINLRFINHLALFLYMSLSLILRCGVW